MTREDQHTDLKSLRTVTGKSADWAALAQDCVCFANGAGGRLLIGIEDGQTKPPADQVVPPELLDRLRKRIGELTVNVQALPRLQRAPNGGEFIELVIERSPAVASTRDGRYFLRVGDTCQPVLGDDVLRLANERPGRPWEAMDSGVPRSAVDADKLAAFVQGIAASGRVKDSVKEKGADALLTHYGLAADTPQGPCLTRLGVLLLGGTQDRRALGKHPFRVAVVCAMWLTGFDVECLSTLYVDKPMRAHTLMQAIARANRVYPGKDFGLIVDYNGMLKSLREALAQYALGDDGGEAEIVAPIEERVAALADAIAVTEAHLMGLGFDASRLLGTKGFARIGLLADAVNVVYTSDETKRRYEILSRVVFSRFKALLVEPSALVYAERHDNIEAIYKKLSERRDTADVSELLKELRRIVNEAIATHASGVDQANGLTVDLSQINMEKLRDEFAHKVQRKATAIEDVRQIVEEKLAQMLAQNPLRMNYEKKYQEIIAAYNQDKDRATIEDTFAKLLDVMAALNVEQQRAVQEGLSEDQLALFDLVQRGDLNKTERERIKQASRDLLAGVMAVIAPLDRWTEKEQTQAEVETFIMDQVYLSLPEPPYTPQDKADVAQLVYQHIRQQSLRA